ncbi:hypothetical protein [Jonesia quinghaiensis]|uniref:hypothetical protein n=1 Tax=Jonesia quinghaiensis TaxID=262806 RepID=UPI0003FFFE38|nr:hypothetical protein [Jonesia quinghaiensis]
MDHSEAAAIPGGYDPAEYGELAHMTAAAIVDQAHADAAPDVIDRLVRLVEREGIEAVAGMWSDSPANTLPGALWRLYMLREWVKDSPDLMAVHYRQGRNVADVAHAIAGAVDPPSPSDLLTLADVVLSGAFTGAVDVALSRASAFCRVVSLGAVSQADDADLQGASDTGTATARQLVRVARRTQDLADDFDEAASLARVGRLD